MAVWTSELENPFKVRLNALPRWSANLESAVEQSTASRGDPRSRPMLSEESATAGRRLLDLIDHLAGGL
jgi:hypothetical protein